MQLILVSLNLSNFIELCLSEYFFSTIIPVLVCVNSDVLVKFKLNKVDFNFVQTSVQISTSLIIKDKYIN